MKNDNHLEAMRHSLAHIMASAVLKLWPHAKFGVGPTIDNGFYYDIDLGETTISQEDFVNIEKEMKVIIKSDQPFILSEKSIDAAITWAKEAKQPYKEELLNDLKRAGTTKVKNIDSDELGIINSIESKLDKVTFYQNGDFIDLCRGPHLKSTGEVGAFKLTKIAGAYWRGKDSNPQMQRLYGVAFETEGELKDYLDNLEDAKNFDHRKLGQELDLFLISPLVGSGLPLFTPRGTVLRDELNKYSQELRKKIGYKNVWTPHIAKQKLYEMSGHWEKFGSEWLSVKSQESHDNLVLKPMNCPHHQQIYASKQRSYRDLPIKYMETTTDYRDEKAGELLGLSRVRSITQDDSHIFCTSEQIDRCLSDLVEVVREFYKTLDMDLEVRLSFRDETDKYLGEANLWTKAEKMIKDVVESKKLKYYIAKGDAAFYGPKIDFIAKDLQGRELQLATPQLDFVQPQRFGLKYTDENGQEQTPVMIHFALMGSIERFLAAYIEHTKGKFPVWLAPEQVRLITVNQEKQTLKFANEILNKAIGFDLRIEVDNSNQSVGKKIRESELYKVPYTVVIGEKEIKSGKIQPRIREDLTKSKKETNIGIEEFIKIVTDESKSKSLSSSL
ncbi:MAG TPA: threonine--tRNA ligase [Candidatus Saccharimonadia bacterium]|nr:threonine--tRNA ligase [Candidatus Saccharimonadia bacterium]